MKVKLLLLSVFAFGTAILLAFTIKDRDLPISKSFLNKNIIRCGPDWESLKEYLEEIDIPPMPGAGNHHWKISTKSDSAQFYFDQGMNMYYSFHIIESMASFKKAARFDPDCAMLYWAQALAYGPNINDLGYVASPEALAATGKAKSLGSQASKMEQSLIEAISVRYTADSADVNRASLNKLYTERMKKAYDQFLDNPDVAALYADAMMLEHPWDLWKIDGTPKPWTPLIRTVLEKLLAKAPNHPGANHYYIHVMEPSPYFSKALPSADRLGKLTPGLSHTVHMPSHIYLRTGHYSKGVSVNENAVNSYQKYAGLFSPVSANDFLYVIHNLHMQTNNAMLAGLKKESMIAAEKTAKSIPADYLKFPGALGSYIQYLHNTPILVNVKFGNWQSLLNMERPATELVYSNVLYHFGRGMALNAGGKISDAKKELEYLQVLLKDSSLYAPFTPFSPAIEGARVAENILGGSIALKEQKFDNATTMMQRAATLEENMVYNEPRDWLLNPKQYLGNALIKSGDYAGARETFMADLRNNNENGWALFGLWQAYLGEKRKGEAGKVLERFKSAFANSDIQLHGAAY
jgi:tetratricopeptide (TPR) repeat protein